jgi:hypothetical protein
MPNLELTHSQISHLLGVLADAAPNPDNGFIARDIEDQMRSQPDEVPAEQLQLFDTTPYEV